jgi:hypothetical protein
MQGAYLAWITLTAACNQLQNESILYEEPTIDLYLSVNNYDLMRFLSDRRAQSIQIGAVLLFGMFIILLSTWQAFGIPNQNEGIEFNQNQEAQDEMIELRDTAVSMLGQTRPQSASVTLGVRYPSRVLFVNPPPANGRLSTFETGNESYEIVIENASATTDGENIGVDNFWDGDKQTYNTGALKFRPNYNLYQGAPRTIYEHSVLFNRFDREDASLSVTDQAIVDNNRITVIALNGSLDKNGVDKSSIDVKPVSTQTKVVEITDDEERGNISIHLPTRLRVEEWQSLLSDEDAVTATASDRFDPGIKLEFDDGQYNLQLAKVGVGTKVTETEKAYLNGVDGDGKTISDEQNQSLVVEVRDEFNNPKSNVMVNASGEDGTLTDSDRRTGSNGQATFEYNPNAVGSPGATEVRRINFSIGYTPVSGTGHDLSTPTNISMKINVESTESTASGPSQRAFDINWSVTSNPYGGETIQDQDGIVAGSCNDICEYNRTLSGADDNPTLPAHTSPEVDDADVIFAVDDSSIATVDSPAGITDGMTDTTLLPDQGAEGETVTVYVWSGGSGDQVKIRLENLTQGASLPEGEAAFNDQNNNGVYDTGEETYSEQDIKGFDDESVDLVIGKDISQTGNWGIKANTVTVKDGVTVESPNNDLTIEATDGDIDISGATIRAGGNDNDLELKSENGDIDARGAIIVGDGDLTASPAENSVLKVNDGSGGTRIEDTSGGTQTLELEQGSLEGTPEYGSVAT